MAAPPPAPPRLSIRESHSIFKRLQSLSDNKRCFCCSARNPQWASLALGVFLCINCIGAHRSHMWRGRGSARSCGLDSWDSEQMLRMVCGGNARAQVFWTRAASKWTPPCGGCNRDTVVVHCASCVLHLCPDCNESMHNHSAAHSKSHGPVVPVAPITKTASFSHSLGRDYQRSLDEEVERQREKLMPTLNEQFGLEQPDWKAEEPVLAVPSPGPLSSVLSLFRDE